MEKEKWAALSFKEIPVGEIETKTVKRYGRQTSGIVTVPPHWKGKKVFVILPKEEK